MVLSVYISSLDVQQHLGEGLSLLHLQYKLKYFKKAVALFPPPSSEHLAPKSTYNLLSVWTSLFLVAHRLFTFTFVTWGIMFDTWSIQAGHVEMQPAKDHHGVPFFTLKQMKLQINIANLFPRKLGHYYKRDHHLLIYISQIFN